MSVSTTFIVILGLLLSTSLLSCFLVGYRLAQNQYDRALVRLGDLLKKLDLSSESLPIDSLDSGIPAMDLNIGENLAPLLHRIGMLEEQRELVMERYRTLTDNLAAAVVIRDAQSKITYCSPFTEVLTGYALSEIYNAEGDFLQSTVHEEDRETYFRALKVTSFGEPFQFRYRFYHKTGLEMWAETRTVPILDEQDNVSSSLSITIDVTGSVRYQKQVEERNRDLQDFTYMVSHDLKAPIFTIKGMIGVIQEDYKGEFDDGFKEILDHMSKGISRLELLVSSVLEYSRIGSQEFQSVPVRLNDVLDEVLNDYAVQITNYNASVAVAPNLPILLGDKLRIYQIFSNLLGNALKYRHPERPPVISITASQGRSQKMMTISVKDNGLGIPAEKLGVIFRPFARVHLTTEEGSGIGLACVKRLVDKLAGDVTVTSEEGVGSIFTVTLRVADELENDSAP